MNSEYVHLDEFNKVFFLSRVRRENCRRCSARIRETHYAKSLRYLKRAKKLIK